MTETTAPAEIDLWQEGVLDVNQSATQEKTDAATRATEAPSQAQFQAAADPWSRGATTSQLAPESNGRRRAVIEGVSPQINAGRFAIKRVVGETVDVEAHVFCDGHDTLTVKLCYRSDADPADAWSEVDMEPLVNDRWGGQFQAEREGTYRYTVVAWVDRFLSWHHDFLKRAAANQVAQVHLLSGAELIRQAGEQAEGSRREKLLGWAARLESDDAARFIPQICEDPELIELTQGLSGRELATTYDRQLLVTVDRPRAGFSAWYEMFPRSAADEPGRHGTFRDIIGRLPYVSSMGFDVLYLPPIHPIGKTFRKGKNNATEATPDDVGSPWGIGGEEGGHKSIHPALGTIEDFRALVDACRKHGLELALDVAFQCSPDHPYVKEHPEWFRQRPDGTIQYAENPPKKYQDIYPFDFECEDWQGLWRELKSIFDYWIEQGVQIFRVDNPHTKPFSFWEWCIGQIKREHPGVLFLAEAFTRPKIMYRLAKLGFTQSYTYFAWRNTKQELTDYVTELTQTEVREFFRANFWPNTPDILTEFLQVGGRAAFVSRLVLAATLSPNYGIYGPPFEHCWTAPREPGSEEYLHSEKYQVHYHDVARQDSLKDLIARVNRVRRENEALQTQRGLHFQQTDNDEIVAFTKVSEDLSDILLVVVNLDAHHQQSGWVTLPLEELELDADHPFQVHDLLSEARYLWHGPRNYVELDPHILPAHIFQIRRRVRTERDFEYYL